MCQLIWKNGVQPVWVLTEDEIGSRPVLRLSAFDYHCELRMAVTETRLHCRNFRCLYSEFRWGSVGMQTRQA